jgi:hypothetical protein
MWIVKEINNNVDITGNVIAETLGTLDDAIQMVEEAKQSSYLKEDIQLCYYEVKEHEL